MIKNTRSYIRVVLLSLISDFVCGGGVVCEVECRL